MNEKVSIIFSTYNSSEYVQSCLKSCLEQDYDNFDVIVSDDGSTDNTIEVLNKTASVYDNFYLIPLPHGERGIARAKAIEKAKKLGTKFLFIIDSDMVLKEHLLKEVITYFSDHPEVGALVIPEIAYSDYNNFYSKVKVFERNTINNAGENLGKNSIEAARFWRIDAYNSTGGININQIAFEETQPTIRFIEKGGLIKRAQFTGMYHNEKHVTLKNIIAKKRYYFSVMDKTLSTEEGGFLKALQRWYFFRPVLYRKDNLKRYIKHPLLTIGMFYMYLCLSIIGVYEILCSKFKKK
ncbi:glycosyltransferase family 2 protein [Clostridium manihotivorum]|uniref:Glycosyl transferase n=1 Tax=Clostridium manihotivorum TaxID=2320868 RepID=A0A410DV26_9CLOT|nr:glycosyltransferase family 2 protein [Clostridium manihotivorum]QAA32939.1 glycosyl transferase [Clostridium manihotivorum]